MLTQPLSLFLPLRLGFFYSPFLPFVILLTSFMLFYVKKVSHTPFTIPLGQSVTDTKS